MPAISPITLTGVDTGSSTANFVFTPVAPQNGTVPAQWANLSVARRDLREVITSALTRSNGSNPADRIKLSVLIPVPMIVDSKVQSSGQSYRVDIDIRMPDVGNANLDREVLSMVTKLLQDSLIINSVTNRVAVY
mgnify:CR=1 FL=1